MQTAAAYIRVSTDEQTEYSPESQLKLIMDYAKKNDYLLPEEFIFQDDGISGASAKKRPQFNNMIAMAKSKPKPFDVILVWKFSRFARNREESVLYKSLLKKNGISVISISEPIIDGAFGSLIESIIEWENEYYLINLSAEVKRGMSEKFSRGEAMGTAPFGYKIDSVNKTYVIEPNQANAVKDIFSSFLAGEKILSIAKRLTDNGFTTNRGNPLDNRFIDYILHNPIYIGKIRWSKNGKIASKRDFENPDLETVKGKHPAIITEKIWNDTQKKLAEQKQSYRRYRRETTSSDWMLKGLVRCSSCGATLVRLSTLDCPSMQCHNYNRGACRTSHSLSIAKANKVVIETLEDCVRNLNFQMTPETQRSAPLTNDFTEQLKMREKMLSRCKEAYKRGIDTIEEYEHNKAEITAEIEKIKQRMNAVNSKPKFDPKKFADKVNEVLNHIQNPDVPEYSKAEALRTIVDKIIYIKPEKSLDIYFCQ